MAPTERDLRTRKGRGLRVLFVAGFGPIVRDPRNSRRLYVDTLGLPFEETDEYLHTDKLEGAKAFALWPLTQAAESCFGTPRWPRGVTVPQAWVEFDVEDVGEATRALQEGGCQLLVKNRREPWGQTVTRLLSPEGLLVGVTHTPWMRKAKRGRSH